MGFLDRFRKKYRRVEDPTFGTLTYKPPWWSGKVLFRPCSSEVSVNFESDEHGPSEQQRERFRELDQKYQDLLPLIGAALWGPYGPVRAVPGQGFFRSVKVDDLPWRPSTMASGVFVRDIAVTDGWEMQMVRLEPGARFPVHTHEAPEFLFILEGELVRGGRRMGPGWASVAGAGTIDEDVHSETGCVFVLVDRA